MGRVVILIVKVLISVGLVWLAFSKIDFGPTWATLRSVQPSALTLALALFYLQLWLAGLRLRAVLKSMGSSYRRAEAFDVTLIGAFFSQTLISFLGGDAMRIWRIVRSHIPFGIAAKSVLFDRIAGFCGLFVLLIAATPFLAKIIDSPEMFIGQVLIVVGALGGVAAAFFVRRTTNILPRWKFVLMAKEIVDSGLRIWRSRRGVVVVLGLSIVIQVINVIILYGIARGLSMDLGFFDGLLLFPTVLFISMLPISIAGWGVREGAMIAGLSLVGMPAHQSLALSVCFGLCLVAVSLPGGVIWLMSRRRPVTA